MARGTVKWFNSQKGYGFIQPTGGGGRDIFVHISAVERAGLSSLNRSADRVRDRGEPWKIFRGEPQGDVGGPWGGAVRIGREV